MISKVEQRVSFNLEIDFLVLDLPHIGFGVQIELSKDVSGFSFKHWVL